MHNNDGRIYWDTDEPNPNWYDKKKAVNYLQIKLSAKNDRFIKKLAENLPNSSESKVTAQFFYRLRSKKISHVSNLLFPMIEDYREADCDADESWLLDDQPESNFERDASAFEWLASFLKFHPNQLLNRILDYYRTWCQLHDVVYFLYPTIKREMEADFRGNLPNETARYEFDNRFASAEKQEKMQGDINSLKKRIDNIDERMDKLDKGINSIMRLLEGSIGKPDKDIEQHRYS